LNRSVHRRSGSSLRPLTYSEKQPEPKRRSFFLCYPLHCWWCWRPLLAAINIFVIASLRRPKLHQDLERPRAAGSRFGRDHKEPEPQMEAKQLPGERPRETAEKRYTGPQPKRHVRRKGAAPLRGDQTQSARATSAHMQFASLISLQMRSINNTKLTRRA
jgi:hypothetical protein